MFKIKQLFYSPVKSLSFSPINKLDILNNVGIKFDRNFAFTRDLDDNKINHVMQNPLDRKIVNFLSLKHFPELNMYNFDFNNGFLYLKKNNNIILITDIKNEAEINILCEKMQELIPKIKRIRLLQDPMNPFFDTMPSKTISLINLNSIRDFEKKLSKKIEFQRFRGNIYVDGLNPWDERNLINKTLIINNLKFKVTKEIPRCVATNIRPNSSEINLSIPISLKQFYNHINLGVYLIPLNDGNIKSNDDILIDG